MENYLELVGNERYKEGYRLGVFYVIKRVIDSGLSDDIILKVTDLSVEQLNAVKEEIQQLGNIEELLKSLD